MATKKTTAFDQALKEVAKTGNSYEVHEFENHAVIYEHWNKPGSNGNKTQWFLRGAHYNPKEHFTIDARRSFMRRAADSKRFKQADIARLVGVSQTLVSLELKYSRNLDKKRLDMAWIK